MSESNKPEEKSSARTSHIASLLTYPLALTPIFTLPFAALAAALVPLSMWITKRKQRYISEQAAESVFFQVMLAGFLAAVPWCFPGDAAADKLLRVMSFAGIGLFHMVSLILAMIQTSYGKDFKHLFSPRKFLNTKRPLTEEEERVLSNEMDKASKQMYLDVMRACESKTLQVATLGVQIQNPVLKSKAEGIVKSLEKLLINFRKDPRDLLPSRHFMTYTLDTLVRILGKYVDMQGQLSTNPTVKETLDKVEPVIDSIQSALEKHYGKMMENDLLELDADIEVMEKTIQMGGF